jgi:6-phosphogluconolactonase
MSETLAKGIDAYDDAEALAAGAADLIGRALADRLQAAGQARFVATGGSTPVHTYGQLGRRNLDWRNVHITLSDERWVDPASSDSNERMLRESLLQGPAAAAQLTPLWSAAPTPEAAAERAESAVEPLLPFDVVLLGMGEDGHFASLFSGSPALAEGLDPESPRLCIGVPAAEPAPPQPRISLTLRALLASRLIVLLTSGAAKRRVLQSALEGAHLPVRSLLLQDRTPVRALWAP